MASAIPQSTKPEIAGNGRSLTLRQERVIPALLVARTVEEAGSTVGVGERTIRTWMTQPQFRRALDAARRQAFSRSLARIQLTADRAVQALLNVLDDDPDARPADRVSSARILLEQAHRAHDALDVNGVLEALEERVRALEGGGTRWNR